MVVEKDCQIDDDALMVVGRDCQIDNSMMGGRDSGRDCRIDDALTTIGRNRLKMQMPTNSFWSEAGRVLGIDLVAFVWFW